MMSYYTLLSVWGHYPSRSLTKGWKKKVNLYTNGNNDKHIINIIRYYIVSEPQKKIDKSNSPQLE